MSSIRNQAQQPIMDFARPRPFQVIVKLNGVECRPVPLHFFDLPGEIRNQIYDLVIPHSHVLVRGTQPQKEYAKSKRSPTKRWLKAPRFRLYGEVLSLDTADADPIPILRVCRRMNEEATAVFYSKTTMCFEKLKTVNKFLNFAPTRGLENVKSISLKIDSYGEPKWTKDCKWKRTWDQKWEDTCVRLGKELTGLRRVELDLRLATWPTQLSRNSDWYGPLMTLKGDGLQSAKVKLHHYRYHPIRLGMAASKLEDRMMTEEGRAWRDLQESLEAIREIERRAAMIPKARKILVIKAAPKEDNKDVKEAEDNSKKGKKAAKAKKKQATPPKSYYKTQGFAGFHRVDLSMVTYQLKD